MHATAATARTLASLVKLEHTIFALPFAYAGMVLGAQSADRAIDVMLVVWVTLAMVGARTLAMGLNRLIDMGVDARNPRTAGRELVTGAVRPVTVAILCAASLGLLVAATFQLDPVTRVLWPIPVALFVVYPYTKRFTAACHLVLGLSIGLAPLGAWLATGASGADPVPYLLWLGIGTWIAGFDVIYATADLEFDRGEGLRSLPVLLGVRRALRATWLLHALTVVLVAAAGWLAGLGIVFWAALTVAAALLAWENSMVHEDDLGRLDVAFFTVNSWVGVVLGTGIVAAALN